MALRLIFLYDLGVGRGKARAGVGVQQLLPQARLIRRKTDLVLGQPQSFAFKSKMPLLERRVQHALDKALRQALAPARA